MGNKKQSMLDIQRLSATELKDRLIGVTVGGAKNASIDLKQKGIVFKEYMQRAFPEMKILELKPYNTTAALNSVAATAEVELDGKRISIFAKVHIESETKTINAVGLENEYSQGSLLINAGWPILTPITMSQSKEYPLLLYPRMDALILFNELEKSNLQGSSALTQQQLQDLYIYNESIGQRIVENVKKDSAQKARIAPVQTFFLKRFEEGGRIDQWYTPETLFELPGLLKPISWDELLTCRWQINGVTYETTLQQIVDKARQYLAFKDEGSAFLTLTHGDDHAGNIYLTQPPIVFDPACAGWNPVSLDLKALAHTGFLSLAGMYYQPKGLQCIYQKSENQIKFSMNLTSLPMYPTYEKFAKQIIDTRLIPSLKKVKELGGDIERESQRIKPGLAGCALLTVNIAKLLKQDDGRATGLLPMAILFAELQGLSALDYLSSEIQKL